MPKYLDFPRKCCIFAALLKPIINQSMMKKLSYKDAPRDWAICFQNDCPLSDRCLRHAVAQLAPSTLTHHVTVLPAARQGDQCSLFASTEPVRIARGMTGIMKGIPSGKATDLRKELYNIFGSCAQRASPASTTSMASRPSPTTTKPPSPITSSKSPMRQHNRKHRFFSPVRNIFLTCEKTFYHL